VVALRAISRPYTVTDDLRITDSAQERYPGPHRYPFHRMLLAEAQADRLAPVSNEAVFGTYGVTRLW